jgi:multidrug efflux pump subunit AcrB
MAINERKVTFLLSLVIFIYGFYAYYFMPKQENPDTSSPTAQIITIFPGATASEVEELVTQKIEDELASLDGVEYITSYSNPNVSVAIVTLNYDVDYDEQWANMRVKLDAIKNELPSNVMDYQINTDLTTSAGIILSLSSNRYTYEQLADYAETYKQKLEQVDGVKRITVEGAPQKDIVVAVETDKLNHMALSIKDIYDLIQAQNLSIPAGALDTPNGKISITSPSGLEDINDIENLIVFGSKENGSLVRLKDIASVNFEYKKNAQSFKQGEDNAILLTVYFDENQNIVLIGEDVRKTIDALNDQLPVDLGIREVLFQPEEVSKSIESFIINLLQGIGFVVLVVLVGMGLRNALVVSATIPLSIMMTLIMMQVLHIDLQQMSIAALIIALGMLVDNSIVISDAVQLKIDSGIDVKQACYEGTTEQSIPILTSTLTTVVAFAPLMMLPGEAGEFAKSLPQVVIIALIASYIVAMLVTPALASVMFKNKNKPDTHKNRIRHFFENGIKGAIKMPKMSIALIMIILGFTAYGIMFLKVELFPYADKDIVYIDVYSEKSGDIEYTEQLMTELRALVKDEPEIVSIDSAIGGGFPKFYLTVGVRPPSDNYGQLLIEIDLSQSDRFSTRQELAYYLQSLCDEKLTGGTATVNLIEINQPGPAVDIKISGQYREDVNRVAKEIYNYMLTDPATINVKNDIANYVYQYKIDVDDDKATTFGLTNYDIQFQTTLAINGMTSSILQSGANQYEIVVKSDIKTIDDLQNLGIKSSIMDTKVLTKQFSTVSLNKELSSIKRHNRSASASVSSNVRPGYTTTDMQNTIETSLLPTLDLDGVEISFGGDQEIFDKYISGLLGAALFAVVLIYIILLIQFNSMLQPFIILVTVPLSIIGSVVILLIFKQNVTFTVGLGVASLIGVVVNNAILLIEHINRERKLGNSVYEACINSVSRRFRPIMLTTTTTVIGLVPMALSGSSFFSPMAMALMGGLMISTLLTLIVIPLIYKITHPENQISS